jgi:hypothetical protein
MSAPIGIIQSAMDGKPLNINPTLAEMLGYDSPEAFLSTVRHIAEEMHLNPDDRQKMLDLICGTVLITGIRARSAAMLIGFLLVVFTSGILVNLMRGTPVSCDCFSALSDEMSWRTLARDLIWAAMTLHVILYDKVLHLERRILVERHA